MLSDVPDFIFWLEFRTLSLRVLSEIVAGHNSDWCLGPNETLSSLYTVRKSRKNIINHYSGKLGNNLFPSSHAPPTSLGSKKKGGKFSPRLVILGSSQIPLWEEFLVQLSQSFLRYLCHHKPSLVPFQTKIERNTNSSCQRGPNKLLIMRLRPGARSGGF